MRRALAIVPMAAIALACATKIGDTRPTTFTEVEPDALLSDLDDRRSARLCLDTKMFLLGELTEEQQRSFICAALQWSQRSAASCVEGFDACYRGTFQWNTDLRPEQCEKFILAARQCKVTVDEYTSCVIEKMRIMMWFAQRGRDACGVRTPLPSPRCQEINETCSGLYIDVLSVR